MRIVMSDTSFHILILERLTEMSERTARMEAEQKNMKEDLEEVKRQDVLQNELLDEHIRGVQIANSRLDNEIMIRKAIEVQSENIKSRVEILEEAPKFRASLKQYIVGVGSVAAAIVAMLKVLKYLGML